jgi:demethylmenaquinone methyltransferase/2-methoxy-6-polyprenyl-1,4-benzoquinol methylase
VKEYYHRRAPAYDDWYEGEPYTDPAQRASFIAERGALEQTIRGLAPGRTLDVACGTGFLTRYLPGKVVGLDQSDAMLGLARGRAPDADFVLGDAFALPFPDGSFDRVFTGHFYGHLEPPERKTFLAEARRVAPELVVADAARRPGHEPDEWQDRALGDDSVWPVFKRFFLPEQLVDELDGGEILHAGDFFVVVRS